MKFADVSSALEQYCEEKKFFRYVSRVDFLFAYGAIAIIFLNLFMEVYSILDVLSIYLFSFGIFLFFARQRFLHIAVAFALHSLIGVCVVVGAAYGGYFSVSGLATLIINGFLSILAYRQYIRLN